MCSKHAMGTRSYVSLGTNRPPKPPSWRDFILPNGQHNSKSNGANHLHFTDLSLLRANSDIGSSDYGHPKYEKNKSNSKKHKATVHRTRSETHLNSTDLPNKVELTISLGKTKPQTYIREYGLRKDRTCKNAQIYLSENAQKCKDWLEGVEACEPLEDVTFAQGTGVDVEIPEEKWEDYATTQKQDGTSKYFIDENAKRQKEPEDKGVFVHRIMVHEYADAKDNTALNSADISTDTQISVSSNTHMNNDGANLLHVKE